MNVQVSTMTTDKLYQLSVWTPNMFFFLLHWQTVVNKNKFFMLNWYPDNCNKKFSYIFFIKASHFAFVIR